MTLSASDLRDLATEHDLTWPDAFLRLADDGLLDPEYDSEAWEENPVQTDLDPVPLLFFAWEFEAFTLADIRTRLATPGHPATLLPFGASPDGAAFCFDADGTVLLVPRRDEPGEYVAADLAGFLSAQLLEAVIGFDEDQLLGLGDPLANAAAWLRSHGPHLTDDQRAAIAEVYARPLTRSADGDSCLLDEDEADELIERIAPYALRGEEYQRGSTHA